MLDDTRTVHKWRVLLTETLPYEVPLIFSNEQIFRSLISPSDVEEVRQITAQLRPQRNDATIPYSYQVIKDGSKKTTLSIIHPLQQMNISEFYATYCETIIDFCNRSDASLRFPILINPLSTKAPLDTEVTLKTGAPATEMNEDELQTSRISSYFIYRKYNLLSKFLESSEFRQLEKQFSFLRVLDISKCFFNLYTHSLTWAVKGKSFSKRNSDQYSFEGSFDKLMQRSNYNETNGIVVGPEISRIFAEIILQRIDSDLKKSLSNRNFSTTYVVKRYVDDYYVFCRSSLDADIITEMLAVHLEEYKLFLNSQKTQNYSRPFVSKLSLARSDIGRLISRIRVTLNDISEELEPNSVRKRADELRYYIFDLRNTLGRYDVSISNVSAWYLSNLRAALRTVIGLSASIEDAEMERSYFQVCEAIIEGVFYICALDFRVRSTYTLCQTLVIITRNDKIKTLHGFDTLRHRLQDELEQLVILHLRNDDDTLNGGIELFNVLISGAHCLGLSFVIGTSFIAMADRLLQIPEISYFLYISLKFCLLKDKILHADRLLILNGKIRDRIMKGKSEIFERSEIYLLLSDFLSAPDISAEDKRILHRDIFGGNRSKAAVDAAGRSVGFSAWTGVNIEHLLARKELRPAYD